MLIMLVVTDANHVGGYECIANDIKCVRPALECLEGGRDILRSLGLETAKSEIRRAGHCLHLTHSSSRRLPPTSVCRSDRPVMLPPGRRDCRDPPSRLFAYTVEWCEVI
jgi:hypothetical protein